MGLKLPFGLKDGSLVEISQVQRGLACGCVCPACSHRLVARKGERTAHHFAHHKSAECEKALETSLHLAAKEIFEKHKKIRIPAVFAPFSAGYGKAVQLYGERTIYFERAILEKRLDDIVPDVVIETKGKRLIIEIAVTHFIDKEKGEKLKRLNVSSLEVDLSHIDRQISISDLEEILIHRLENKSWIHNTRVSALQEEIGKYGKEYKVISRGLASHIDYCPKRARVWQGKPYANLIDDCFQCDYLFDFRGTNSSSHTHITCVGHAKKEIAALIEHHKKL